MNSTGSPVICRLAGVVKDYPGQRALDLDVLELRTGKVHALVGQNGAGKSTLVRILSGATSPTAGQITLHDRPVVFDSPAAARAAGVAVVFQELSIVPNASALENANLGLPPPHRGPFIDWRRLRAQTVPVAQRVGLAAADLDRPAKTMSVADLQMLAICRALLHRARLLLLDEPTASLSEREVDRLFTIIRDLTASGVAVLYISHRLEEVAVLADQVTVLRDGQRVATLVGSTPALELVRLMTGGIATAPVQRQVARRPGPMRVQLVDARAASGVGLSLTLNEGEIVGVAGLVGSGRTTVARMVAGLERPAKGQLLVDGAVAPFSGPRDAVRAGVVFVPEDRRRLALIINQSVAFNITLPSLSRFARGGVWLDHRRLAAAAASSIDRLAIRCRGGGQPVRFLSGGNQQKTVLARWILHGARVLVVDEPTIGLDVAARAEVHRILRDLAANGAAVLFISSDFDELCSVVDRAVVIREGQAVANLAGDKLTKATVLRHCYQVAEAA